MDVRGQLVQDPRRAQHVISTTSSAIAIYRGSHLPLTPPMRFLGTNVVGVTLHQFAHCRRAQDVVSGENNSTPSLHPGIQRQNFVNTACIMPSEVVNVWRALYVSGCAKVARGKRLQRQCRFIAYRDIGLWPKRVGALP
jgi:hypothetical protein